MYLAGILPLSILLEIMNPAMDEIVQVFQTPTFYRQAVALLPNGVNNGIRKFTTNETYFFLLLLLYLKCALAWFYFISPGEELKLGFGSDSDGFVYYPSSYKRRLVWLGSGWLGGGG